MALTWSQVPGLLTPPLVIAISLIEFRLSIFLPFPFLPKTPIKTQICFFF